ncbi:DNA gyrase inhibitor YacG [Actibacterium sp. MT2.3-13A]|uniref:DNA gyrase inhibitor YacG n=1 Tax=Actibacterium sp. MT2.3-13A TaxID=2828332 RepID=UPI001BA51ECC|nr:DNA gyrase inhibitor YacG [Actibacterium sp. MT2.3-13A]
MTCPICAKASDPKYRPFCSKRCADVDLGRWLSGRYAVAADAPEDLEEAAEALAEQARKLH